MVSMEVSNDSSSAEPAPLDVKPSPLSDVLGIQKPSKKRDLDDWEDREGYMHVKQRKLRKQFEGMGIEKKSAIFEGVCIYVNGWTQPTAEELKVLIHAHGGKYEYNMYPNSVVTHTVASNLPNSKILKLGSSIVCKPSWIVDSIAANMKLPVDDYLLYKPQDGQQKLAFLSPAVAECENRSESESKGVGGVNNENKDSRIEEFPSEVSKSSKGADFVNEFFSHSRLHYLSTWSTELKQFTADMLKKITPRIPKLPGSASLRGLKTRAVIHIDLDCFFVSVSRRDKPHLCGKPVAVTHAKKPQPTGEVFTKQSSSVSLSGAFPSDGSSSLSEPHSTRVLLDSTSDVASCSYEARSKGVTNGMLVGTAVKKCPDLILLPYDFIAYRQVSQIFYEILFHYSSAMEAVSCDEAYIELTDYCRDFEHVSEVVQELRNEVQMKTHCTVSAGIAHNMLLARMCTRVAKPDGQFYLPAKESDGFLCSQRVRDIPGVGYSTANKLSELGIENCADLKSVSLDRLQSQFGTKNGRTLHDYARGIDNRELKTTMERKSISVDINFGIRFQSLSEAEELVGNMAEELQKRAELAQVLGNQITLKMKIRKQNAPKEPKKYLGHGSCDNVSRSMVLLQPIREARECKLHCVKLLKQLNPVAVDIRGMGLQLSKLVPMECSDGERRFGADLRKLFKSNESTSTSELTEISRPQALQKALKLSTKSSPRKEHAGRKTPTKPSKTGKLPAGKSPTKSPAKMAPAKASSKSLKQFFGSCPAVALKETLNDSFRIELPPSSQLDHSVLEALPGDMRQKILQGYATKGNSIVKRKLDGNVPCDSLDCALAEMSSEGSVTPIQLTKLDGVVTDHNSRKRQQEKDEEIVIHDEKTFLSSWKTYIGDWLSSFSDGPVDCDITKVADYLRRLARSNLVMAELCLKSFRRLIELHSLSAWCVSFSMILQQVQERVKEDHGGTLKIEPLH